MGCEQSALSQEKVQQYQDLTFFSKREILRVFHRYSQIANNNGVFSFNEDNYLEVSIPCESMKEIEELKVNPFNDRIVSIFCSDYEKGFTFEDFLDMLSVFSVHAPREVKVEYAFKIYDFNEDDYISADDLEIMIQRLTSNAPNEISDDELKLIVDNILKESDLDNDNCLSFAEFEHVISKAPDFVSTFTISL